MLKEEHESLYQLVQTAHLPFLGQSHVSAYRRNLAESSTTISYCVYVVILGVCLRLKPHWMFQIYKYVIKGREKLTSCSSLIHIHMFPLLDVLYRQVGNLSFGQWCLPNFVMAASNHIVAAIQGAGNTMTSAWDSKLIYLSDLSSQRKQASYALSRLSTPGQGLSDWPVLQRATFKVSGDLKKLNPMLDKVRYRTACSWVRCCGRWDSSTLVVCRGPSTVSTLNMWRASPIHVAVTRWYISQPLQG